MRLRYVLVAAGLALGTTIPAMANATDWNCSKPTFEFDVNEPAVQEKIQVSMDAENRVYVGKFLAEYNFEQKANDCWFKGEPVGKGPYVRQLLDHNGLPDVMTVQAFVARLQQPLRYYVGQQAASSPSRQQPVRRRTPTVLDLPGCQICEYPLMGSSQDLEIVNNN